MWSSEDYTWFTATSLRQLYTILHDQIVASNGDLKCGPGARMVAGNTSVGVYPPSEAGLLIDVSRVPELLDVTVRKDGVAFGGGVTIADVMKVLDGARALSSTYGPLVQYMQRVSDTCHLVICFLFVFLKQTPRKFQTAASAFIR